MYITETASSSDSASGSSAKTAKVSCMTVTQDVLLKTATVLIIGVFGYKRAVCLIDDGSMRSFIRGELAEELKIPILS